MQLMLAKAWGQCLDALGGLEGCVNQVRDLGRQPAICMMPRPHSVVLEHHDIHTGTGAPGPLKARARLVVARLNDRGYLTGRLNGMKCAPSLIRACRQVCWPTV